jgi:rod shape-determining protein MreC
MLERLYNLFLQFREYVLLAGLVVLSFILLSLNDRPQVKQIRTFATVAMGVVQNQLSFIPRYFQLKGENEALRRVNVELADEASRLREAKLENMRLRSLLGLKADSDMPLVAANVVSKNLTLLRNSLTLDAGTADGIQPSMPVLSELGLVGVVIATSENYSIANILWNTDFRASAKVQRSRVDGILAWDGQKLILKNIAKTLDVKAGDVLVTSDYSNTYPPDIRIGIISSVREEAGSLFREVVVTPSVDFVRLEQVFVLTAVPDSERVNLETRVIQMLNP